MSAAAQCVSGFGQGTDTSTVLTNRSKHITIIADEPYFSRHSRTFPPARHKKGSRPMHRTTLTYEVKPVQTTYVSCMKAVGKHFLSWTVWGNRCELFKFHPGVWSGKTNNRSVYSKVKSSWAMKNIFIPSWHSDTLAIIMLMLFEIRAFLKTGYFQKYFSTEMNCIIVVVRLVRDYWLVITKLFD